MPADEDGRRRNAVEAKIGHSPTRSSNKLRLSSPSNSRNASPGSLTKNCFVRALRPGPIKSFVTIGPDLIVGSTCRPVPIASDTVNSAERLAERSKGLRRVAAVENARRFEAALRELCRADLVEKALPPGDLLRQQTPIISEASVDDISFSVLWPLSPRRHRITHQAWNSARGTAVAALCCLKLISASYRPLRTSRGRLATDPQGGLRFCWPRARIGYLRRG